MPAPTPPILHSLNGKGRPAPPAPPPEPSPAPVSRESIAKRAFEKFLGRGSVHGFHLEDWRAAERELLADARPTRRTQGSGRSNSRLAYQLREEILMLLTDDEVAKTSNAEGRPPLQSGDEYIDLEQLERGVQRASGAKSPIANVLPRKALLPETWDKILVELTRTDD